MTHHARLTLLLLLGAILAALILAPSVPLTVLVAALIAVAIRALADPLHRRLRLPEVAAVLLVVLALLLLLGLGTRLASGPLAAQAEQLGKLLPSSLSELEERLQARGWGRWLLGNLDTDALRNLSFGQLLQGGGRAAGLTVAAVGGVFGGLGSTLFTVLLGIYFALHPETYLGGLLRLLAPELRPEAVRLLHEVGATLRGWLGGQLFSMAFIGSFVALGLWLLGVPLFGLLAALSALLGFIPIIGPIIAAVPAVLLAASQGLDVALWVVALYVALHVIEGDVLTPMIQSHVTALPPGLLLTAQLFMGAVFGLLGLAVAAPLAAILLVLGQQGYVRRWVEARGRLLPPEAGPGPLPPTS
ncbi:AI-2E family transporter [Roseomonas sp. OT10]|uniref:AI-2E family transporter n=1 Tax=Roseomonas cutis TaxID=2897332 RepID=UPI001E2F6F0A|nr:AI-2E family transporter [Roseomonas sp. OT10]UFN47448.1 AI-2E family transporter [Roseomonas sp. OT10]